MAHFTGVGIADSIGNKIGILRMIFSSARVTVTVLLLTLAIVMYVAARSAPRREAAFEHNGTITEVHASFGCGFNVGVAQVRYGDRFGVVVPCIELLQGDGLRFAVGDSHRVIVDDRDRVRAIEWHGHRYRVDGYPSVMTPAWAIGRILWSTTASDNAMHYSADGWRWN